MLFLIRSDVLKKIGFLDENVFLYYEENILGKKISNLGMKVMLDPNAEIVHYGGKSTGKSSAFLRYHNYMSALYFLYVYQNMSSCKLRLMSFFMRINFFLVGFFKDGYWCYIKKIKTETKKLRLNRKNERNNIGGGSRDKALSAHNGDE